ncbi:MAG: hypothetical protein RR683_08380, partial [Lachnospiraceae bacterium]
GNAATINLNSGKIGAKLSTGKDIWIQKGSTDPTRLGKPIVNLADIYKDKYTITSDDWGKNYYFDKTNY